MVITPLRRDSCFQKKKKKKKKKKIKLLLVLFKIYIFFILSHKLWTEICEIRQIFKGDLIKFYEIFTKITLELPQNGRKPIFKCKKLVINTTKCD